MITKPQKPRISILGCGWYGFALAKYLIANGYTVKGSTTSIAKLPVLSAEGISAFQIDFKNAPKNFDRDFFNCDVLLISIPPKSKDADANFEVQLKYIVEAVKNAGVKQVVLISSTGIYADENAVVNETVIPKPNTSSGKILAAAEAVFQAEQLFTTTIIRFAGLIGEGRNLAKHFAGKKEIPNGLAPINLIHLDDCLGLTFAILEQEAFGTIYHGVTPDHPRRADFYTKLCAVTGLEEPAFLPELLQFKQINSVNVPALLKYDFTIQNWNDWLKSGPKI